MTLNDILKDPNYQGLPEAERRKVWHKLFDRQYGSDPNFLGLPEAEQSRARDMYADRVMGSQRTQVQTAAQTGYTPEKDIMLQGQEKAAQADQQRIQENMGNITPSNYGVGFPFDKAKHALDPSRDQAQIRASRPTRTRDEDLKEVLSGNELRPDYMLTPEMAHDKADLRSIKAGEAKEIAAKEAAKDRRIASGKLENEYFDNEMNLAKLSVKRDSWDKGTSAEYTELLQRQAEIESEYPAASMGMTRRQYDMFQAGQELIKDNPLLTYPDIFVHSLAHFVASPVLAFTPGSFLSDYTTYPDMGVASEGSTLGNMLRGTVGSLPMNIAMMVNPAAGAALTFTDITSRDIKQYYDAGTLDAANVMASIASGAIQTVIEYMSTESQLAGYRDIYRKGGTESLQSAVLKETRDAMMPSFSRVARSLAHGAITEGLEEVLQNVADRVVKMVMLDEPMPGNKQELMEWGKELALDFAGGSLGGFLMGGGATGVQIYQHNEVAKYIQHNAKTYESIQMLQQSIDLINNAQTFEDIDMASDLLRDAKAKAVKEGVEHPRLLQGFNLASSAIMASRANQVQAIKAANQELGKEITELKQKADAIRREGFEPGFETEQGAKLYDLEDQIKVKEREYKKGLQQIHSNKELEMMGEAIERMDIEMAQLHAESAGMPYGAEYDPSADQGKEIKAPVMMEGRRRETMPEKKAAPIESKQEDSTSSSEPVPIDSNTVPSQTEGAMPAEPANTENDKTTSIKLDSETKQSKSLTIGKINEDVDRVDPKESKRIPEEALGGEKTVVKGRGKGSKHKIRHALISLKDILVSHDAEFNENKDYPQELQPRDRSKGASRAKNNQVTAELDPYRLMDNYLASEGRPIVVIDKDGRIIALTGNGRLIALKRRAAGEYDGIQEYEQTLREHLEDFGFNDQDTAGKVLVGVYYGDADLIQLANAMNESEGDAMSPVEQAAADAKQIANLKKQGDDIIEALDVNTEDVMSAANTGFLKLFAERLGLDITKYQTADGKWNKDFRARVENALFMYIFSNNESAKRALSAWREDETSNMKSVLTGVMNSIKLIAKYRNAVEKYKTVDLDITVDLLEAIDVITRLRKEGKTLEQEANEMDLFSDGNEAIPSDKLSLYQAIAMIKTIKRGTEFIKGYYSEAMDLADPNQMSFLYDPNTSKEDFLNQYTEGFIKRNEKKKDDRSAAQRSSTKTPATPHGEDREGSRGSDRSEEDVVSGRRLRTGANESRLNSIPDSVAEDALLGLFKSHIAKTERDGRKLIITFKDGRKLTLDRLNKNFKITMPDGRKLDVYGRTHSKTIDGTFNVFMDLVDGLNGGNRTLYHEAFHVAWKLFMTTEQIDMISRYYAKKLGPEASIVDIEEAAANAAQNWLGNRAEVPPGFRNIFRGFWDRVRHALVSLGLANENQKIEDIFWGLEQDRLQGKGTEDRTERHRLEPENRSKSKQELVNPIDPKLSDQEKVLQLEQLRDEATPVFKGLLNEISNKLGLSTKDHLKDNQDAIDKTHRPDKPEWYSLEHLGDYYRGMVTLTDQRQIIDIAKMIDARGMGVVEFEYMKTIKPEGFGYRDMNFILRMPNGLMVEFQAIVKEIAEVKPELHKIYSKWRGMSRSQIVDSGKWEERYSDQQRSYAGYNNAWRSALKRWGISHEELIRSLMKDFTTLGLSSTPNNSHSSSTVMSPPISQAPSEFLKNGSLGVSKQTLLPSRSSDSITSDNFISTSSDKISQSSDNATFSQGKSLVADTENLNNETEVRYRLESGDNKYAFNIMEGYKPTNTVKGYKAFVRDKDGNLKPLFVSNDITIPVGKWLEAKDTWHFQAANGLYYVPTGGEDVDAKKSKKKKDEKKTGENVPIPNEKVRAELIKRGFLPKGSKAMTVKAVAYRPGWHGSLLPLAKQLGNQTASISRNTGTSFDGYDYSNVYQEDIVFAEVEFDMSNDYQGVASKETGLQRMPEKGGYQFTTNKKNEDPKNPWFISGAIKVGRVLDRSEVNELVKKAGLPIKKWRDEINTIQETTRYRAVEEKNLVTIHNIPADSIEKVNNRGGMVMPSIAIIDATKTKFTGFGDASLIGDEKMIQPSAKQPLYTSDAYTPTYPKVYEIVKMDKNLEALAEYLSKKTKKKVTTWDLEANIEDQGSERYVASLLYGVMDYKKAQKEAIRTLEQYPINIEEKLFAGYTASGKRRYIPHTAENALRIMRKDSKDDPSTFWGTSSLRGALAAKFSSLAQAKKNRDMILSKAEMEPIEEATDKMFEDIAARANAVRKNQRAFYHSDIASDIYDMARYGWGRIADWYKDDSIKEDFRSFISHLRSLPTQYFEYKPQRVMGINEFVAAVIPTGTKASTAKALRDAGLKVVKYEAGNDEARYEAVKKVSEEMGVRFRAEQAENTEAERQMADVRAKYEGTDQWMKAPNGEPTKLNERQWLQVRTQLFKDWFGDWENDPANASKVVDENGEPMVVYHSSPESFTVFDITKSRSYTGTPDYDLPGVYFTPRTEYAEDYGDSLTQAFLNFRNPFTTDLGVYRRENGLTSWREVYESIQKEGYDGVMVSEGINNAEEELIALQPAQIKSATANVGAFDPQNPDIRYRVEPSQAENTEAERQMADVRAKYEGTDQWMKAPNGEPTKLNERQWLQVRTQLFKDWFGDWENDPKNASKVVDENGEPLVVYHGTNNVEAISKEGIIRIPKTDKDVVNGAAFGKAVYFGKYAEHGEVSQFSQNGGVFPAFISGKTLDIQNLTEADKKALSKLGKYMRSKTDWLFIEPKRKEKSFADKESARMFYRERKSIWDAMADNYDRYMPIMDTDGQNFFVVYSDYDTATIENEGSAYELLSKVGFDKIKEIGYDVFMDTTQNHIVVYSDNKIKSATANVGTFDPQNPDIRYRIEDTDLDARLKRAHEMLKKYKANVDPKEASKKIATEIAKAKNLDPGQADEKIGRMIRAAYREGEGKAKESLAAFGIAETEAFIQTNKPDGTDKQDLTFHMEEALEYAADMGLSEADVKSLGTDRFTYYLKGLNMYAYGNELTQQLNEKYAERQALAAKGITDEALDQEISNLISLVADARLKYENMKGAAGRLLQHARWEKSNRIKDLIKIAEVITETRDAQIAEINAIEAEMAELNTMLTELEKEFELLLDDIERLSGSRFKSDSIEELRERKRLMAEQRAEMKNRMEVLKHRLTKAREGLQTSEKQNRAIREQLDKAGQIEFTEEEQNVLKQIVESGVLSEEQLEAIGTTMKTGFRPTATGLKAIAPLTGSTSDLTPKQAALIQKILDHGKKPPTVTEFPLMDADWIDVVSNAFYQIILSSPVTHARNLIGNEANLALENIVNTVLGRDLRPVINSILSAKEGVRNTKEAWKHAEAYMKKYNLDTNSRIMKKFTMITRALAAEDAFYYSRNYAAQITSIAIAEAKRTGKSTDYILRNPTLAMIKQAEYEASRGTWNYDPEGILGYITKAIEIGIGMAQQGGKLGKISALLFKMNVMPFTRVVANVLNTAMDWSPVGYLGAVKYATGLVDKEFKLGKGITIRQRKVWTDEKGNAISSPFKKRDTARQLARATMGTIMLSLAYMLLEGIVSGSGPDDWEKRKQMMETGWRPNSIKIAGRWHSYMMLPIAPMLSAIANFQERRRKPGARAEEVLAATVMGMANTILDQSFLSNLAQLMEAITGNNHRYLIRAAADTPTRVIPISPNLLRVIADAVNDKAYAPETFIQYLMYSGRPWTNGWIKANIPARIDVFGRESKKTSSFRDFPGSPVMDGQPLYVYDKNDIPHDMRSLLNTILGAGLKIPSTNAYEARVGDDQFIKLKGFDKEQFLRQRGFYLSMGLLSHQEDIEYLAKEGDIDAVKDILQKIATRATRDAKREMIYRYIDGEMRHKYSVYSKSRNRRKDEED